MIKNIFVIVGVLTNFAIANNQVCTPKLHPKTVGRRFFNCQPPCQAIDHFYALTQNLLTTPDARM